MAALSAGETVAIRGPGLTPTRPPPPRRRTSASSAMATPHLRRGGKSKCTALSVGLCAVRCACTQPASRPAYDAGRLIHHRRLPRYLLLLLPVKTFSTVAPSLSSLFAPPRLHPCLASIPNPTASLARPPAWEPPRLPS
ncbi:Os03g0224050 [Oryza sativa Japonica Group]|uniref:Os03g0224050 protein n=1 Tax=Oryza sativa subsp. japonica TaxID=39947 RepID=A0A0N7KGV1_ORYSJ|nr:Os03g0224050 [Oryza sativa Japonica Group]